MSSLKPGNQVLKLQRCSHERSPHLQVWFEVSPHTSRVYFHLAEDGSQPLGLSLPLDLLRMPPQPPPASIVELLEAAEARFEPNQNFAFLQSSFMSMDVRPDRNLPALSLDIPELTLQR